MGVLFETIKAVYQKVKTSFSQSKNKRTPQKLSLACPGFFTIRGLVGAVYPPQDLTLEIIGANDNIKKILVLLHISNKRRLKTKRSALYFKNTLTTINPI